MTWSCAGAPVIRGRLSHPASGTWTARVQLLASTAPAGQVTLDLSGVSLAGTVVNASTVAQRTLAVLVGGRGKLATEIPGQHFLGATARLVAQSILSAAGELLDPASDGLDGTLETWTYFAGPAGVAVAELARGLGLGWWITAAGQVRLGTLTYPAASVPDALLLDPREDQRSYLVALEQSPLLPRTTWQGRALVAVDHELSPRRWRAVARW